MKKIAGEKLRDDIAALLSIKYQISVEKRLIATTADIFFVDDTNPIFPRKIALEAKDWTARLSSENIASIYNLYAPSLASREIDFLWIVGRHPLSSSPKQSLDQMTNVRYSTFDEFRASLMNFNALLNHNILLFEHEDASKYYVQTRVRHTDEMLLQHVEGWLRTEQPGLIVYGGYGLGKTTFSLSLASALSKSYLSNEFDRIPIRLALGGMYSKQDLTALICSALSGGESGVSVKDFSYGLFLEMNRQGQYLLILDGFDEMRHAMDLDDFVYTFEQMKPLFSGRAKVIILGRPDSFLSTQEEKAVLSALFDESGEKDRKLRTVEVAFFSKTEILGYLENYLRGRTQKLTEEQTTNFNTLISRLPDTEDSLLSRPVQLKMFTKIIEECLSTDVLLNRYELYKRFIYNFIDRETRKPARQPTEGARGKKALYDDRATFMQSVAWWLLNTKKENKFLAEDIPMEIVPPNLRAEKSSVTAIREAIVGSVIEPISQTGVLGSKAKRFYFFPHKSYLEFLVANFFEKERFSIDVYRDFIANINNEILSFIEEGPPQGIDHLRQGLTNNLGAVDRRVIEVCASERSVAKEARSTQKANRHPSHIYTHYFHLKNTTDDVESYLLARLVDSTRLESLLACLTCIGEDLACRGSQTIANALVLNCLTSVSTHNIVRYLRDHEAPSVFRADGAAVRAAILSNCIFGEGTKKHLVVQIEPLFELLSTASKGAFHVPLWTGTITHKSVSVNVDTIKAASEEIAPHIEGLVQRASAREPILRVHLNGPASERFEARIHLRRTE